MPFASGSRWPAEEKKYIGRALWMKEDHKRRDTAGGEKTIILCTIATVATDRMLLADIPELILRTIKATSICVAIWETSLKGLSANAPIQTYKSFRVNEKGINRRIQRGKSSPLRLFDCWLSKTFVYHRERLGSVVCALDLRPFYANPKISRKRWRKEWGGVEEMLPVRGPRSPGCKVICRGSS